MAESKFKQRVRKELELMRKAEQDGFYVLEGKVYDHEPSYRPDDHMKLICNIEDYKG